jgi:CubicO group peptidase (beta-lactamase class C family)
MTAVRTRPRGIDELADRLARRHVGVVLGTLDLASDATEIEGRGRLRRPDNSPPGPDTLFEIGSITKTFTSLALAVLVGSGTVSLRTPLRDLLPAGIAVPRRDHSEISLEHLARHISGLPRSPNSFAQDVCWPSSAGRTPTTWTRRPCWTR